MQHRRRKEKENHHLHLIRPFAQQFVKPHGVWAPVGTHGCLFTAEQLRAQDVHREESLLGSPSSYSAVSDRAQGSQEWPRKRVRRSS